MTGRVYTNPQQFRHALDQMLRNRHGGDLSRVRQLLVFERLLARLVAEFDDAVILKGGLALELRLTRARTTKDVDIRFSGDLDSLLPRLQAAGRRDLRDYLTFEITVPSKRAVIDGDGALYEGRRFKVAAKMAGKPYGSQSFGLDVGVGDPMIGEPELVSGEDYLDFIGVPPPQLRIYPFETHLAEKLHAYTLPRDRPNSRDKDLLDMALMSTIKRVESTRLRAAIERTFAARDTHPVPPDLPAPPAHWASIYAQQRDEHQLPWLTLELCHRRARQFVGPILTAASPSTWAPDPGAWRAGV